MTSIQEGKLATEGLELHKDRMGSASLPRSWQGVLRETLHLHDRETSCIKLAD